MQKSSLPRKKNCVILSPSCYSEPALLFFLQWNIKLVGQDVMD